MSSALLLGADAAFHRLLRVLALVALVSTFVTGYILFRPYALGLPHAEAPELDERQFGILNRSQVSAYRIVSFLFLVVTLYISAASNFGLPLPTNTYIWQVLYFGVTLLVLTLPTAILAWTEADADDRDLRPADQSPQPPRTL